MSNDQPALAGDAPVRFDPIEVLRHIVKHIGVAGHGARRAVLGQISGHGFGCDKCDSRGATPCADCRGSGSEAVRRVLS